MKPEEVQRLSAIFLLMTDKEARAFLWHIRRNSRTFLNELATGLGIENIPKSQYQLVNTLQAFFSELRKADQEPTFECVGCGGLTEATGLRWDKLNKGEAVTVSVDHSNKPRALSWLTDEQIMKHWFEPWTVGNPNIKFELLKTGKGDSHITFEPVDGPGNTLKFVWQPSQGEEMDTSDLSGDMVCDNSERTYPRTLVRTAGKHEVGHVLGIGHLSNPGDLMYPTANAADKKLTKNDKQERDERYPIGKAA